MPLHKRNILLKVKLYLLKRKYFPMQEEQLLRLVLCSDLNVETYEIGIDERPRNENKTHFE